MPRRRAYRAFVLLYPKAFRHRYRADLEQAHDDLVAELGRSRAWARVGLDLLVTVPRYRLEAIVSTRHSDTTLNIVLVLAVALTVSSGALLGGVVLAFIVLIALTQRSRLAKSLRVPHGDQRRRRLRTAAALAGICAATLLVFVIDIGGDEHWGARAVIYVNVFNVAFVAAIVYLVSGLLTRRTATDAEIKPVVNH